jgi:hypothetical protein
MIKIYPKVDQEFTCPICNRETEATKIVWQGIHVGVESMCKMCQRRFYQDLLAGHSISKPCSVDLEMFQVFCDNDPKGWYSEPLRESLKNPSEEPLNFRKEIYSTSDKVIILNCIDYLYGHALLKLLNAERHLKDHPDYGLIVIVPKYLEWMTPKGIAEKWIFDIPLKEGKNFFIEFNEKIQNELHRFSHVCLSKAYAHPSDFDITNFTEVKKHDFQREEFRISFIWREDRVWINSLILNKAINKSKSKILKNILLRWQKRKIVQLFSELKKKFPYATYTATGIGKPEKFPGWIDNQIVQKLDEDLEKKLCHVYSESRVIIGVHGSNMLLPSAHAGMTIDLMPDDRWGNFAQDILYQENDVRISSFRYRFIPINQDIATLKAIITNMISNLKSFVDYMTK